MAKQFTLTLQNFGGLHLPEAGETPAFENESPDMVNFRITESGQLKLREGFRTLQQKEGSVRALWHGTLLKKTLYIALIGEALYKSTDAFQTIVQVGTLAGKEPVSCLEFREKLYFLTGRDIFVFDGEKLGTLNPYRPLIRIASPPGGGGIPFEDANALTPCVRQTFSPDGTALEFRLTESRVESIDYVLRDGHTLKEGTDYIPQAWEGSVRIFGEHGEEATAAGTENIEIGYTLRYPEFEGVRLCRFGVTYGGDNDTRAFLYGNPNNPAVRYYSGLVEGLPSMEYFPTSNLSLVGDGEEITSIVRHYDRQIIFTPHATYYSYPVTRTDETGKEYTSFPVFTLSAMRGNSVRGLSLLVDNKPLSVTASGLFLWNSTSVRDERNAVCFSERIAPALRESNCRSLRLFLRGAQNELYLVTETGIFVFQYRKNLFYYYEGFLPTQMIEDEACRCFFGTEDGRICILEGCTDDDRPIPAHWKSGALFCQDHAHKKHLHSLTLGLSPESDGTFSLAWYTDNATSRTVAQKTKKPVRFPLFRFDPCNFNAFSFDTSRRTHAVKLRIGAKRFSSISFCLSHPEEKGDLCLTHLVLHGTINDQRI